MSAKVEFKLVGDGLPADVVATSYDFMERLSTPYEALVTFHTTDATFKPPYRSATMLAPEEKKFGSLRY